jgi:hypothetical protein
MEHYTGTYRYQPLRRGVRTLYKPDGTFPPPDLPANAVCMTGSITNYRMYTTGDVRILELLPGSFSDPIYCRLHAAPIESDPIYDALSYMWGDPTAKGMITLEDEPFAVTISLENALRHMRLRNDVRYLWADAVCINQRDIKERGNQVHLMKEIYSRCQRARVWIDVDLDIEDPGVQRLFTLRLDGTSGRLGDDPDFWAKLVPLLQHPYWNRLWIQQELVFAPDLIFHCRKTTIPGHCLMALQHLLFQRYARNAKSIHTDDAWCQFGRHISIEKSPSRHLVWWRKMVQSKVPVDPSTLEPDLSLAMPRATWQMDPSTWSPWLISSPIYLLGMLRLSQRLDATEPRDRVIAALNLVIDYDDDGTETNYDQSLAERYLNVARVLLFKCNSLQFLALAKTPLITDTTVAGLPTWVPNWNLRENAECFLGSYRAAGDLPMYGTPFQEDIDDGILHARGFRFAYVNRVLPVTHHPFSPLSALSTLFISTITSGECQLSDLKGLANTLIQPAIFESNIAWLSFEEHEAILYTGILLDYSFVTPGLRVDDLLSYTELVYEPWQRNPRVALEVLQKFRHLRPSCLRWLDLDAIYTAIKHKHNLTDNFGHFIRLVHQTFTIGFVTSTSPRIHLTVTERKASVQPLDEIWVLFGCPTPMVIRNNGPHFLVISPAYIADIMNGEAMKDVITPDVKDGGWHRVLQSGIVSPAPARPYVSGKDRWVVEVIRLR